MSTSTGETVWIWDGLHCGNEPTGPAVTDFLKKHPVEGVHVSEVYPEARALKRRYVASGEIGSHFTDAVIDADPNTLDPDQLAVQELLFNDRSLSWIGIDPHCFGRPNSDALVIGEYTEPHVLGLAAVFGLKRVTIMRNYPFFDMMSTFGSIETFYQPGGQGLSDLVFWRGSLEKIVKLGFEGMLQTALDTYKDLTFYDKITLQRTDATGTTDPFMCDIIQELEAIPDPGAAFVPVDFTDGIRSALGLPADGEMLVASWGDNNMSPIVSKLGRNALGHPRRVAFGSVYYKSKIPPYIETELRSLI